MSIRARRPSKLRKLLVIDDDASTLASYQGLLAPHGFDVLTASDGHEAITVVEHNPDIVLVVLDLAMPKMDGREWLRWFRGMRKESPVIVITGYAFDLEAELKPSVVLHKPFDPAEFLDMVGLFCGLSTPVVAT